MSEDGSKPRPSLREQWKLIRRMFVFMLPVKLQFAVTGMVLVACIIAEVFAVRLLKPAIDIVNSISTEKHAGPPPTIWEWLTAPDGSGAALRWALIWLALAKLILSVLTYVREIARTWKSMSMVYYMRAAVYDRLQRVGFAFHDNFSTGQLINRAISDLQAVRMFVNQSLFLMLDIVLSLIFYFTMLVYDGTWEIALLALVFLPVWIWAIRRYAILSQPIYKKQSEASDEMVRRLTENVAGVHVVRAFATEEYEKKKFGESCKILLARLMEGVRLRVQMVPIIRGIALVSQVSLFALGATLVQEERLTPGALVAFGAAMGIILSRIQQINAISDAYQHAVVSSGRLFEILDHPDTTPQSPDAEPLRPGGGAVRFSHVTFGYDSTQPVLKDVSFSVPAGSVVALVGPTGSGKTTLTALLARFYDPDLGKIEIDGQDLRDASLDSVRQSVGFVFQETYLFSDTIARNIAYGDTDASREKIKEAARIARADEFIERLPNKYENMIGEYGATLSGGQRQRLSIARAILHNPRILVLDDALAAVDPETEAQIRGALSRVMTGRTVFMITSRISTARRANVILVIENGRLTQQGSHDELMQMPGYYRDVASSQFGGSASGHTESHMDRMSNVGRKSGRILADG
ncbi:MAG TPA: ABC transporter ATP-binding protein [Planctomycetota bacterium]|nr:ABC transporter ATP-binding protein [Planctomycetota bacterium]